MSKNITKRGLIYRFFISFLGLSLILFLISGDIFWLEAWIFIIILLSYSSIQFSWLFKHDKALLEKRINPTIPKRNWDKQFVFALNILTLSLLVLTSLDKRLYFSQVPLFIKILSFPALLLGLTIIFKVMKENTYLSKIVEIQKSRKHKVISTGTYSIIRHPMYFASIIVFLSIPLTLGSFLGLIPALAIIIAIIIRTRLEDRTLLKELKGYRAYSRKVKYKLLPEIW